MKTWYTVYDLATGMILKTGVGPVRLKDGQGLLPIESRPSEQYVVGGRLVERPKVLPGRVADVKRDGRRLKNVPVRVGDRPEWPYRGIE